MNMRWTRTQERRWQGINADELMFWYDPQNNPEPLASNLDWVSQMRERRIEHLFGYNRKGRKRLKMYRKHGESRR